MVHRVMIRLWVWRKASRDTPASRGVRLHGADLLEVTSQGSSSVPPVRSSSSNSSSLMEALPRVDNDRKLIPEPAAQNGRPVSRFCVVPL